MNNKKLVWLVLVGIVVGASGLFLIKSQLFDSKIQPQVPAVTESEVEPETTQDGENLTPEEVLERLSEESETNGEMSVAIVSPVEATFQQSQARLYKAEVTQKPSNTRVTCSWKFYLNQYDTEELYREVEAPGGSDGCGFTQTFIDRRGQLRVVVTAVATNTLSGEEIARASAEMKYVVE